MYDVIVIGAGPGGSSTAQFLAQYGMDVLLLDKSAFPRDKTCGDGLTPRALGILEEIGVLDQLLLSGYRIDQATVFAPEGTSVTTWVPARENLPPYMLTVPRLLLDDTIRQKAIATGAKFQEEVKVTGIDQLEKGILILGRHHKKTYKVKGQMAVIAVGASMKLLFSLGILKKFPDLILAARTYYEGLDDLNGRFEFHFDGIPLPGYGWIFPLSTTSANIGAGIMSGGRQGKHHHKSAKLVLEQFLQLPIMRQMMASARQIGPMKGYPLRTDFATAPTFGERMLLVGEAAGLVNPLTGEGVDFALESGKIAALHLIEAFEKGDFSRPFLSGYDLKLRIKFQRLFVFSSRIRKWYLNKPILNRLVHAANQREQLRDLFTDIVLGNIDASQALSLKTIWQIAFTR